MVEDASSDPDTESVLNRLGFPAIGRHGRFVTAIGIDALGSGVWMPLSVLYFTVATSVSLVHIGIALSVAAAIAIPFALVVGQLVDRFGAKTVLQTGNLLQAVGFAAYPFAHSWWAVTLVVAVPSLGRTAFWGSYSPLVAEVSDSGEREKWFGFLGALRNSGFAIGGLLAAAAISIGSVPVFHAVVLLNAASYLLSFALLVRVRVRAARPETAALPHDGFREVLRDRGYRWLVGANTGYALGCMALNIVMPLYILTVLDLPGWVSGAVYVVNTVLIGVGQGLVVRRMTGQLRWRIVVQGAGFMVVGFVLMYAAGALGTAAGVVVVLVAAVAYTFGEMVGGPVLSTLAAESPPEHLRGRYLAAYQLSWNGSAAVAPAVYLFLLDRGSLEIWGVLVAVVVVGALCCLPLRRRLPLAAGRVTNAAVVPG